MKHSPEVSAQPTEARAETRVTASDLKALDQRADRRNGGLRTHIRAGVLMVRYSP